MLYIFIFVLFFRKKIHKRQNILKLSFYTVQKEKLKYVSQTLHPSSQHTRKKKGVVLHFIYIYIYIKHMGICFYTHWTLFQIYNGYLKKNSTRQILPTKLHH